MTKKANDLPSLLYKIIRLYIKQKQYEIKRLNSYLYILSK